MTDERASPARRRARPQDEEPLDPEQEAALSRAAREAVRQPADPRIEASFAHLGLLPEPDPDASARPTTARRGSRRAPAAGAGPAPSAGVEPPGRPVPGRPEPADLQPVLDAVGAVQRSTEELRRRLDIVTWLLLGVTALMGLLAVILILRGPG